ncbi:MAG: CARDB domain-containing protein, partial [Dehalococcoidales bacterium]|nr:CARDB domain-containing protein [Dehalococcoidales bacterium]
MTSPQTYTCPAKPATGTVWNTVSSYEQTWNDTAWTPASDTTTEYNTTAGTNSCQYICASGYTRSGTSCVALLPDLTAGAVSPVIAIAGTATTFSSTISNGGNASSGIGFTNFFQSATDVAGTLNVTNLGTSVSTALAAAGTVSTSRSYTFASSGTFYLRACADKSSASNSGSIAESNENNNCGPWTAVTICTSGQIVENGACTTPTYACTGTVPTNTTAYAAPDNTDLSADTAYSYSATDTTAKCQYKCSSGYTRSGTSCVLLPDLTAGTISPTSATVGTAVVVSSTITNIGTAPTGTRFYNRFETATNATGSGASNWGTYYANALAVDGSVSASITKTLTASGNQYIRACADRTSIGAEAITESDENNNCSGWTLFTVSPAACTGTLPDNTTAYPAPDNTGLTVDTAYTYSAVNTISIKCQYACSTGYTRSGTNCVPLPDLTAGAVSPVTATAGTAVTLSAIISSANASTGTGFTNLFQKATDATGTGAADIGTFGKSNSLAADDTVSASLDYTFPSADGGTTRYIRACADKSSASNSGSIAESNENNNCGAWTAVIVSVPARSDLTAGAVSPTSATVGVSVTLSAPVTNNGNASTGVGFTNLFQKATDAVGTGATDIGTPPTQSSAQSTAVLAGGSAAPAPSISYTFSSTGTYYIRACADKSSSANTGAITESNELNNCGAWTTVTVSNPAIAGSCSVSPDTAFIGESFTWSTSGVSGGDGTYTCAWSGTESLSGTGSSVEKSYTTTGDKTGSVVISSAGNSLTVNCTNSATVTPCYGQGCGGGGGDVICTYSSPAQPKI